MNQDRRKQNRMERHLQTILVSLITVFIGWISLNSVQQQEKLGRIEERMVSMVKKIDELVALRTDVNDLKVRVTVIETKQKDDR